MYVTSNNDSSYDEVTETKLESLNEQLESSKLVYVTSNNDLSSDEVTETKLDSFREEESSKLAMVRWTSNRDGTYVLREDQLPLYSCLHTKAAPAPYIVMCYTQHVQQISIEPYYIH